MLAKELIEILQKNPELELGSVSITSFMYGSQEAKKETMLDNVKVFGEFKKSASAGTVDLRHDDKNNNLSVTLYMYDTCKVVGHRVEKRKFSKPVAPVEMMEVEEEIKIPVTDCEIKQGDVKADEVVFAAATI